MTDGPTPIGDHGFLADAHTAALLDSRGSIVWLCLPRFDSPSVFGRLLDLRSGGAFELAVEGAPPPERRYLDGTLVLESRWDGPEGKVVISDFLALHDPSEADPTGIDAHHLLVRLVRCTEGTARVRAVVDARPDYARERGRWRRDGDVLVEDSAGMWLSFEHHVDERDGVLAAEETLRAGQAVALAAGYNHAPHRRVTTAEAEGLLRDTVAAWWAWGARGDYDGVAAEQVHFSARVLRGLAFDETGALVAAPTTSLPEWIGGLRNWDYRFTWHRDATLHLLALLRLGHHHEARQYMDFLLDRCAACNQRLEPMIGIGGNHDMEETTLDHLEGYAGSRPVRIGNEAHHQLQLDTYGHVLDAALTYHEVTGELTREHWDILRTVVDMACDQWRQPDQSIWEMRGEPRHYTYSKLMLWVCLDRGLRLAEMLDADNTPVDAWRDERQAIRDDLLEHGYDEARGSFVQSYGSKKLDAALLRVSLVGFLEGDDPRVTGTIDRIIEELADGDVFLHRYDPLETDDGFDDLEGGFLLCAFDLVSALVLAGRLEEAKRRFAALCACAGPLGLFAEQVAPGGDGLLGNFPQAFTHLSLIEAALNLDEHGPHEALHEWADRHLAADRPDG